SSPIATPSTASAGRLLEGLHPVAARCGVDELRAFETWYANDAELFDRVAMAMDALPTRPDLARELTALAADIPHPFGPTDTSRAEYRAVLMALRAEVDATVVRRTYSAHAVENEYLVGVISGVGALERELRDSVRVMPAVRGNLTVAIVGRTKSGKTTLRKALTRDADRSGIGRGAHRTTRQTTAFELGSVTYLDTPGVAAKDEDFDTQRARAACEVADAVIWNYADTLRTEEAEELQRLLLSGKPLLVVVNVKDRVDKPDRLRLFVSQPGRAFASASGHTARIEQVAEEVGVEPPAVLLVHSGAAHEALSASDRGLADRAFQASRLPDLEQALQQLLAKRAVPLRAVRLADRVRSPLATFHDRAAAELPGIDLALADIERSAPDQRDDLLGAIQVAGQGARDRLSAQRQLAKDRLSDVIQSLGGRDHARRWSEFLTGLGLEEVVSGLEADFVREMARRGRVLRGRGGFANGGVAEVLQVKQRPDASVWDRVVVALEEAGSTLLGSVALRGLLKKFGAASAGGPGGSTVVIVGQVLEVAAAAAKAVSRDVDRAREALQVWKGDTVDAAEAELDALFGSVDSRLDGLIEDMTMRVHAQFDMETHDVARAREHLERLRRLHERVRTSLDQIDLILARRLLALAGGDPTLIHQSNRTPGVELCVWTDSASADEVQAALSGPSVRVLTERIVIRPEISSRVAATGAYAPGKGKEDD
ncbi:MAG: 50S ribosome-binding GTPase, partial [Planctomycetes bacterium]|nr:50S ribosome-binding GTPase [Planctomycetota bacterium]